jgi:hypothetical protein
VGENQGSDGWYELGRNNEPNTSLELCTGGKTRKNIIICVCGETIVVTVFTYNKFLS